VIVDGGGSGAVLLEGYGICALGEEGAMGRMTGSRSRGGGCRTVHRGRLHYSLKK
jgi:hypothetical protein